MAEGEFDRQEGSWPPDRTGRSEARTGESGTRTIPIIPHDGLFLPLISDPGRFAALIGDHLTERIVGELADTPPAPLDCSILDEAMCAFTEMAKADDKGGAKTNGKFFRRD